MYTWPSEGNPSPKSYVTDETNVEWTEPHLEEFLTGIARIHASKKIHIIAHSMGNRALTKVIRRVVENLPSSGTATAFQQIFLAAPDIDAEVFGRLSSAYGGSASSVTLYAAGDDRILWASRYLHSYPRAGEIRPHSIVVVPGIETIDVSKINGTISGHSYMSENPAVLKDIAYLLGGGPIDPRKRGAEEADFNGKRYWKLTP
jgi:esterase/lipase superfamily enzyme